MANIENKLLPVGTSDFSTLRLRNQIYVDKTELIYQIASQSQKFFLARPRRFGKSLLISTFESLFKYGLRDFKGLAIENLWKEECTYNVVGLDFSLIPSFSSVEVFSKKFMAILSGSFSPFGFNYVPDPLNDFFDQLFTWMRAQPRNSLVILIDEYDAPLTGCLNNKDLFESVRAVMANFYAILKSNDRVLRLLRELPNLIKQVFFPGSITCPTCHLMLITAAFWDTLRTKWRSTFLNFFLVQQKNFVEIKTNFLQN